MRPRRKGEIYITAESESFHSFGTLTFKNEKGARKFAAEVNKIARQMPPVRPVELKQPIDAVDQVRKLAGLVDEGLLTPEEFEAKKKQLLGL